jgi:isopropylmalate/homocitrate/citramalate synthase
VQNATRNEAIMNVDQHKSRSGAPASVTVIDCTLRDGEQAPGVWFTLEEKLELAKALSEAGVAVLDAGFPASSPADLEAMQEMRRLGIKARLAATARPVLGDVVAAEKAKADEVFLFMPTSDFRLRETLGITRERAAEIFRAGAEAVAERNMRLNLVFEDATRAKASQLVQMVETLRPHVPIERLVICDTVGCAHPSGMEQLMRTLDLCFDGEIELCSHSHNDFGFAGANTLAAVVGGARAITCTVNGIGERAGNADLAECVAALTHIYAIPHGIDARALPRLSQLVERMSGLHTSVTKPVTGFNVYRHESGVHVDGMLKDSRSYEFLPAAWVGRASEYVLGKHSGTALIRHLLNQAGLECNDDLLRELLRDVKDMTSRRDKDEHRRAYSLKEAFARFELSGIDPAIVIAAARQALEEGYDTDFMQTATVKVKGEWRAP